MNSKTLSTRRLWRNMTKSDTLKLQVVYYVSCLPLFIQKYEILRINENHPKKQNKAYLLSKR